MFYIIYIIYFWRDIGIYTSSETWINNISIYVWFVRIEK